MTSIVAQERLEVLQDQRARFDQLASNIAASVSQSVEEQLEQLLAKLTQSVEESLEEGLRVGLSDVPNAVSLSEAVVEGLRRPLAESFRTAFASTLLPGFENAIKSMLAQVQQRIQSLSAPAPAAPAKVSDNEAAAATLRRRLEDEAARTSDRREKELSAKLAEMHSIITALAASQVSLTNTVNELKSMQQQATAAAVAAARATAAGPAVSSAHAGGASSTPAPPATPKTADVAQEVFELIASHQFEAAFTRALSSAKLAVVLGACKQLDPRTLLSTTVAAHKLSAPVVLSLIQQLSFSLPTGAISPAGVWSSSDSETDLRLKLSWLRECVIALPASDPMVAQHVRPVLTEMNTKLEAMRLEPSHALGDLARMVAQFAQMKLAAIQG
jgi:hypothetical protein